MNEDRILFQLRSQKSAWTEGRKRAEEELLKAAVGEKLLTDVIEQIERFKDDPKTYDLDDISKSIDQFCTENLKYDCTSCPFRIPNEERKETLANADDKSVMCMAPLIKKNIDRILKEATTQGVKP